MKYHLRAYLLLSGYILFPSYFLFHVTRAHSYFPLFYGHWTSIVTALGLGLILYSGYLCTRYFTDNKPVTSFILRALTCLIAITEVMRVNATQFHPGREDAPPNQYYGIFAAIWTRAFIADLGPLFYGMGTAEEISSFYRNQPFTAYLIMGPENQSSRFITTEAKRQASQAEAYRIGRAQTDQAQRRKDAETAKGQRLFEESRTGTAPSPAISPRSRIQSVSSTGVLIESRFYRWGKQTDGITLELAADQLSVIVTPVNGAAFSLVIPTE